MSASPPSTAAAMRELLGLIRGLPPGHVTTTEALARHVKIVVPLVATMIANLTDDERELVPWHRVVAKGGAIGRGPHRDRQFALLMREGVVVSPAGVVQDMARVALLSLDDETLGRAQRQADARAATVPSGPAAHKSRGMRGQPGSSGGG